jgi:hypothetical protein
MVRMGKGDMELSVGNRTCQELGNMRRGRITMYGCGGDMKGYM